jgi:hypothetical protein
MYSSNYACKPCICTIPAKYNVFTKAFIYKLFGPMDAGACSYVKKPAETFISSIFATNYTKAVC